MMETAYVVKYGVILAGVCIMAAGFWYHSIRKMTANLAIVWVIIGTILVASGISPALSAWTHRISAGTGVLLFFAGAVCVWGGFQFSCIVAHLTMKNRELAMQVSLLNRENERIRQQLEELEDRVRGYEEKTTVCD